MKYIMLFVFASLSLAGAESDVVTKVVVEDQSTWGFLKWIAQEYGPLALFIAWQGFRDWKREEKLGKRLDDIQDKNTHSLLTVIKDNTTALERGAEASKQANVVGHETKEAIDALSKAVLELKTIFNERIKN